MTEEKSHVGMGHKLCPVCLKKHDEVVLLDQRLQKTLTRDTFMGYELCPEDAKKSGEYLAIVGLTGHPQSNIPPNFTGETVHVRWEVAERILTGMTISKAQPFVFAPQSVIDTLKGMVSGDAESTKEGE